MTANTTFFSRFRLRAAALHLGCSILLACVVSFVVFLVWYPPPYAVIAGGMSLFALLIGVDVVLGPALTLVVANPQKNRNELIRDFGVIVLVQLAALAYGIHTIAAARPVYLVFEIDRFRVVTAADIEPESLKDAQLDMQSLPWFGPRLIAAVKPTGSAEFMESVQLGLAGIDLSMIPRNWRSYGAQQAAVWAVAKPVDVLIKKYPESAPDVSRIAKATGQSVPQLRFLPMVTRRASWVVLISQPDADVVGYLPLDGFF